MSVPTARVLEPIFGKPLLRAAGNGIAKWSKVNALSQWQKGTGWQASLTGGAQTGADWAAAFIPTNGQLRVKNFNNALWSYYMTAAQTMGVNIVIWVHNPDDFSDRAEITQLGNTALLGKSAGWNSHKLLKTTTQFLYYGENIPSGTGLTSGTQYTWAEFQADVVFRDFTIYRVSLEYGWEASGTFQEVWLAEVSLNGIPIPIMPSDNVEAKRVPVHTHTTGTGTALASLTPAVAFKMLGIRVNISTGAPLAAAETLTVTLDSGDGAAYDEVLFTLDMGTPSINDVVMPFGDDAFFEAGDVIVVALSANAGGDTWGCETIHELV